ncbi:MAG: insulinase family protein, partial [Kiritimatiellae bacterium]|nr:insulinase family protein [Kiritimatiellia bacterium]
MKARMLMATAMAAATACAGGLSLREGDVTCGFRVKEIREMPDLSGRLWRMEYAKNGADLVWLETEDMNKTFAIAFKTLPEDDTGVAHIIEHSLLCGSVKYPVKEPFVELLKSSLATYINASTSSDCTMYPVCSRNDRDLLNLAGVYLDAVFDPLSVTNDWAMPQERNVVCNEMKGAMSSPYSIAYREMAKMLFPDNAYSSNSGGDPDVVPTLTAEAYRAFYRKFYHPSNARIFLFGKMDVPPMLELVSSYLCRYDRRDPAADPPAQPPVASAREIEYPCDSAADRVRLCEGWAFGTWRDADMTAAMDVLCDLLAGGNDAPLKKALLDAGVCEDVEMWCLDGFQNVVNLTLVNVRDGRLDEARRIVRGTLEAQVRGGFDADRISAKLDQMEFRLRERDSNQLGLAYMRTALTGWLHGGNPAERLEFSSRLAELRSRNGTGYFEKLFSDAVLSNKHHATLVMKPRTGSKPSAPSPAPDARAPEDLPENIAKLPRLRLADIPEKCDFPSWSVERVDGVDVVRPLVASNGIVYAALAFSVDDLSDAEMKDLPLL